MPKQKKTQETKDLEDQLRGMILGNVRIASNDEGQHNQHQHHSPRGRGRGRGFGHHGYVAPHQRILQDGNGNNVNSAQQPGTPTAMNGTQGPASPQSGFHDRRGGSFGHGHGHGHHRDFSGQRGSFGSPSSRGRGGGHQALYSPGRSSHTHHGPGSHHHHQHNNSMGGRGGHMRGPPQPPPMAAFIAQCEYLDKLAAEEIPKVDMTQDEFMAKDAFRARLEIICREEIAKEFPDLAAYLNLRAYGSFVSGFATKGSDVDLTILWSGTAREDAEFKAQLPRVVEKAILRAGHGARLLGRTRVPIIKVCEMPHRELYEALVEERQKWEQLPEEEKWPTLAPQPESPVDAEGENPMSPAEGSSNNGHPLELDPDLSRSGKKMETIKPKRVMMSDDPLAFLIDLKSKQRTEDDDLARYCTQFINARRFALQSPTNTTSDQDFTEWFLEGLPASVTTLMAEDRALMAQSNANYPNLPLFEQYYEVAHPIIARLDSSKRRQDKDKHWLREKALGKLDYPKQGVGIQCDINFSNPLGMHNTELLRLYSLCDPRVRPMVLFVKSWTKRRKINSAYSGTLSSYGYVLMVLHFLVNVASPPVLPNLQHVFGAGEREEPFINPSDGNTYNISFHRDEAHLRHLAATGALTQNTEPLGPLLRNFFNYYATQSPSTLSGGFNYMRDVLSLRTPSGLLTKEEKGWTGAKTVTMGDGREVRQRYLLAIEDPFETGHNVGRPVTHHGIVAVRDEFRRAWRVLQNIGRGQQIGVEGLFDEVVEKVVVEVEGPGGKSEAVQVGAQP